MRLENLLYEIGKGIRLVFYTGVTILLFSSCYPNKEPDTTIMRKFNNMGKIEYSLSGIDEDGSINYISAKFNNLGDYQTFDNNSVTLIPIINGNNTIEAIAYDDKGLSDSTPATTSFISPTKEVAKQKIVSILNSKEDTYAWICEEVMLSLGTSDGFLVDYLVRKKDGTDAVINYISHQDNLATEVSRKELLNSYGIPNLYLGRIPEDEIQTQLDAFIEGNYN